MIASNQRVGEYVLHDRISAGTFGEVWRAHHHVWTDQIVAVKIPTDPQYLRNPRLVAPVFKKEPNGAKWDPTPCSSQW